MKKRGVKTAGLMCLTVLLIFASACNLGDLGGLFGGGDGTDFQYDPDYISQHLTGDYSITYRVTGYATGEQPSVTDQTIARTDEGYYFATTGTSDGDGESARTLFLKMGDVFYLFEYDADEDRYERDTGATYTEDTMKLFASTYFGYLSMYAGASGLESVGTETIAGRECEKYKYSASILGLAGVSYHYSIDKNTGVCLKYAIDASAGGEKSGFEFVCTAFNTTSAALPDYVLAQSAPERVIGLTVTAGDGQAVVSWTPGYDGGSPITGYEVSMDNWDTKETVPAGTLTYTFTGLTNGTPYTFKVRAVNAFGDGADSAKSAVPAA